LKPEEPAAPPVPISKPEEPAAPPAPISKTEEPAAPPPVVSKLEEPAAPPAAVSKPEEQASPKPVVSKLEEPAAGSKPEDPPPASAAKRARDVICCPRIVGDPQYITKMFADSISKARPPPPKRSRILEPSAVAQQFLSRMGNTVQKTKASAGGASFRQTMGAWDEEAPGRMKQRFKAYIQPTIVRDDHPHAPFTLTFTPSQMREYVKTFRPVPLLIEHEIERPSIGTLERVWLEGPHDAPRLCGEIYFHMRNEDSRAALRTVHRLGGSDLSLFCSHEIDPSGRKVRTHIHEISVVARGKVEDGCFFYTSASARDFDRDLCLTFGGKCYIDETLAF
jgi:hypothetical protein